MNLRSKQEAEDVDLLRNEYLARNKLIENRLDNTEEIENSNERIIKLLGKILFNNKRMNGTVVTIKDTCIKSTISFSFAKKGKESEGGMFEISTMYPKLKEHITSKNTLKHLVKSIQQDVRLLRKMIRKDFKNHKITDYNSLVACIVKLEIPTKYKEI